MKAIPQVLFALGLGCLATPAFADSARVSCGDLYCTITCNGTKAEARCEGMGSGAPVCTCETKGTMGGYVKVKCKSATKEAYCAANERPGGHCKGLSGATAVCVKWQ